MKKFLKNILKFSKKNPKKIAINLNEENLNYNNLINYSNLLIKTFVENNLSNIGIFGNRTIITIISILATQLCGKTFIPLNPKLPNERLKKIISSSDLDCIIVSDKSKDRFLNFNNFCNFKLPIIFPVIQNQKFKKKFQISIKNKTSNKKKVKKLNYSKTSYIMFTTGSTGEPKGVKISYNNLDSYLINFNKIEKLKEKDIVSATFDNSFDLSVHDIFATLGAGAKLVIFTDEDLLFAIKKIKAKKISIWFSVPSLIKKIISNPYTKSSSLRSIRLSLFCGEMLPTTSAISWCKMAKNSRCINLYGPTETTIAISYYDFTNYEKSLNKAYISVPIGKVFSGNKFRIKKLNNNISKDLEKGELLISGSQVSKGYLNNTRETKRKFIKYQNKVFYKSGDIVKMDENKKLYFLERSDNQVKISGYRIEISEIENTFSKLLKNEEIIVVPEYKNSVVENLVLFTTQRNLKKRKLLASAQKILPKYMIPKKVKYIKAFPLNQNNKIDRNQLLT
tara:strand:- start:479 stop:2002 length:1524 start_codon:yes stop_codon:yes gene_type:complete